MTCVGWEPDELAAALADEGIDSDGWSLDWVLWHLADALAEEGVVMSTAALRELATVEVPPGYPAPR